MKKQNKQKKHVVNIGMILITFLGSLVSSLPCWLMYEALSKFMPGPITIGLCLAFFLLLVAVIVVAASSIFGFFVADIITGRRYKGRIFLYILIGVIICGLLMAGLDFVYELDIEMKTFSLGTPSTFVFLVDDSGSMEGSDPTNQRYQAIQTILEQKPATDEFMVYAFGSEVSQVLPMQTVAQGVPTLQPVENGITEMAKALTKIIEDYENGVWKGHGGKTVILITDGAATDINSNRDIDPVLKRYVKEGISISTVGLGYVDEAMLNRISSKTGGTSMDIDSAGHMQQALEQAIANTGMSTDLLSARRGFSNILRGIMRVVFIAIYGILFGLLMMLCYGHKDSVKIILISSIIKAILAGLVLELGIELLGFNPALVTIISALLVGTLIPLRNAKNYEALEEASFAQDDIFGKEDHKFDIFD